MSFSRVSAAWDTWSAEATALAVAALAIILVTNRVPEIVILRLRNMTALDATGLRPFEELAQALQPSGRQLPLCGARHQPAGLIARADFQRHVGGANICANLAEALRRAREIHEAQRHQPTVPAA